MGTILKFIGLNWPFFAGVVVTALLVWGCITCQNRGEALEKLKVEFAAKTHESDSIETENRRIDHERQACREEQLQAALNYKNAQIKYVDSVAAFRVRIAGMTTAQKQQAILDFAKGIVTRVQTVTVTTPGQSAGADTVMTKALGTVSIAGKQFPYYTDEQQNLLLWALGEGSILKDQRETTDQAAATLPVIQQAMYDRITEVLEAEIKAKHFLGIGQKAALKQLRADIDRIFREYAPVPVKPVTERGKPPAMEASELEAVLPKRAARRG